MLKLLTLLSLTLIFLVGCTRENSSRSQHDRVSNDIITGDSTSNAPTAVSASLHRDADEFLKSFKSRLSSQTLESDLQTLGKARRETMTQHLDRALEVTKALPADHPSRVAILDVLTSAVLSGCDESLKSCRYVSLFRGSPSVVSLLLFAADQNSSDIQKRYQLIEMSYALVGQIDDPRIDVAYLDTTVQLESELMKRRDQKSYLRLVRHRETSELALRRLKKQVDEHGLSPEISALLSHLESAFDLWNFDRVRKPENSSREELLLMMVATKAKEPAELKKRLLELESNPASAIARLAKVGEAARIALGVKPQLPSNFATLVFENLWLGRINQTEADILWDAYIRQVGDANAADALREQAQIDVLNYARTRLLSTAIEVNKVTTDFLTSKDRFEVAAAFQETLKESLRGSSIWKMAIHRFNDLNMFHDRHLRGSQVNSKTTKEIDFFFASIDRNIKLTSTYPSMLAMIYHLARLGFSIKLETYRRTIEINAGEILEMFFDGTFEPWMPYNVDETKLSKSEIQIVFYYALELGTLSQSGAALDHLFKMLTEQMTGQIRASVMKIDDAYEAAYETNPLMSDFQNICLKQRQATDTSNPGAPQINLEQLQRYAIAGLPQGSGKNERIHPSFSTAWSFFELERDTTSMRLDENLEILRLQFTPKITRLRTLQQLVEDHIQRHQIVGLDTLKKSIEDRIAPLERLRQRVYSRVFRISDQIGPCGEKLIQSELTAQNHVIKGLVRHFHDVHGAMKALREKTSGRHLEDSNQVQRRFGFTNKVTIQGLDAHEAGLGFTTQSYRLSRLQILLRIKDILEVGFSDGRGVNPPQRLKNSIVLPLRVRDVAEFWREQPLRLDWNEDADEFVTNGIQQVFDDKIGFLNWDSLNSTNLSIQLRLRAMAALAKVGNVETDQGVKRITPKEVFRQTLLMEKWLEVTDTPWANVLTITGEYIRAQDGTLRDFAWDEKNQSWWGLLDFAFKRLTDDKLGAGGGLDNQAGSSAYHKRAGAILEYSLHAKAMMMLNEPGLKVPDQTMNQLKVLYTNELDRQMELATEALIEIKKLDALRTANPNVFPSWRLYSSRAAPHVPMLSDSALEAFRIVTNQLTARTGYKLPPSLQKALNER